MTNAAFSNLFLVLLFLKAISPGTKGFGQISIKLLL
jgi:hypothetical protein